VRELGCESSGTLCGHQSPLNISSRRASRVPARVHSFGAWVRANVLRAQRKIFAGGYVPCEATEDDAANDQARRGFRHKGGRIAVARVHPAVRGRLPKNPILGNFDPALADENFQYIAASLGDIPAFHWMTIPLIAAGFALGALQTSIEFVKRIMAGSTLRHQRRRQQDKPGGQAPGQKRTHTSLAFLRAGHQDNNILAK
jgi:hypothetical protein